MPLASYRSRNACLGRVSPVASLPRGGLLTEPTAVAQPSRRNRSSCPRLCENPGSHSARRKSFSISSVWIADAAEPRPRAIPSVRGQGQIGQAAISLNLSGPGISRTVIGLERLFLKEKSRAGGGAAVMRQDRARLP